MASKFLDMAASRSNHDSDSVFPSRVKTDYSVTWMPLIKLMNEVSNLKKIDAKNVSFLYFPLLYKAVSTLGKTVK